MPEDDLELRLKSTGSLKGGDNSHQKARTFKIHNGTNNPVGESVLDLPNLGGGAAKMGYTNVGDAQSLLWTVLDMQSI